VPQRLQLMRVTFQKFFPWVWVAILLLLVSGYWMMFTTFGGFAGAGQSDCCLLRSVPGLTRS